MAKTIRGLRMKNVNIMFIYITVNIYYFVRYGTVIYFHTHPNNKNTVYGLYRVPTVTFYLTALLFCLLNMFGYKALDLIKKIIVLYYI